MAFRDWLKPYKPRKKPPSTWYVYLLRCADDTVYCGVTVNIHGRILAHNLGKASKYTRSRLPVTLLGHSIGLGKSEAHRAEYQIKQLTRDKKLAALAALR